MQKAMFMDRWIYQLSHAGIFSTYSLTKESADALKHLFSLLPKGESHSIWIKEKSPSFEEYRKDYPYGGEEDAEDTNENLLMEDYRFDYPFEFMWYQFKLKHE